MKENGFAPVKVYPNPFKDNISIEFDEKMPDNLQVRIINQTGSVVMEFQSAGLSVSADLGLLPPGSYILMIDGRGRKIRKHLVKL
jgi:hypothetical protein